MSELFSAFFDCVFLILMATLSTHEMAFALGSGVRLRQILLKCIGGLLFAFILISSGIGMSYIAKLATNNSAHPIQLAPEWGSDKPASEREKGSRLIASMNFVMYGKLGMYFDQSTGWQRYWPTENDIKEREKWLETLFINKLFSTFGNAFALACALLLTTVAWLGFRAGRKITVH